MDTSLYHAECLVLICALCGLVLLGACRAARRVCGELNLETCVFVGFGVRVAIMLFVAALGASGETLRGPDDAAYLHAARTLADAPFDLEAWLDTAVRELQTSVMAVQLVILGDAGELSLRAVQATIALLGIVAMAAGVGILAGGRAAMIFAWIAMLEPSNAFFSTLLHKESLAMLAGGLVFLGLAFAWRRSPRPAAVAVALGLAVAASTRSYAATALAAAVVLTLIHALARQRFGPRRALALMGMLFVTALAATVVAAPRVAPERLEALQLSQDYQPITNANLQLGPVEVTTSGGLARALATRSVDLVLRPHPWQLSNLSQQLGAIGTVLWFSLLLAVAAGLARIRGAWVPLLIPIAYLALALLVVYALTLNNAAQGYRHRVHLVVLLAAAAAIVWRGWLLPRFRNFTSSRQEPASTNEIGLTMWRGQTLRGDAWQERARRSPTARAGAVVVAAAAASGVLVGVVAARMPAKFSASAIITVPDRAPAGGVDGLPFAQPRPRRPDVAELILIPQSNAARADIAARARSALADPEVDDVAATTDVEDSEARVVFDRHVPATRTISVTAYQPSSALAARVSVAYAREIVAWRDRVVLGRLRDLRDQLRRRARATAGNRAGVGDLEERAERIDRVLAAEDNRLLPRSASLGPNQRVSPNTRRNITVGSLAGGALALLVLIARRRLRTRG